MEDLRQIVELRPDPVPDLLQLLAPVTGRIDGPSDPVVVVARCLFNDLLQGRELLDAEFLETDRIDLDLLGELRDVEHLFFRLTDVAVDEVPVQINVVLRQDRKRIADLLLGDALVNLLQDPVVGRLDPDQKDLETRLLRLVKDPRMLRNVNPGLGNKDLLDLVLDDQVAKLFAPLRVGEEVIVAEEHDIGRHRLQFFDDRFDRSFRVVPLLAERIETEGAELAVERTSPRGQYRVEGVAAESNAVFHQTIIVSSQGPVRKRNTREVRQRMDFVVDDSSVLPIGKPTDILAGDPRDDLLNDFFALTPNDHVDIRTTVEQGLDFLRCFMASDDRADLRRQLGHEITDLCRTGIPIGCLRKEDRFRS